MKCECYKLMSPFANSILKVSTHLFPLEDGVNNSALSSQQTMTFPSRRADQVHHDELLISPHCKQRIPSPENNQVVSPFMTASSSTLSKTSLAVRHTCSNTSRRGNNFYPLSAKQTLEYRKDNLDFLFPSHNNSQVIQHLHPLEPLIQKNIINLRSRNKP
jgi:hypothetical protein